MNIKNAIRTVDKQILEDRVQRVRIAKAWVIKFRALAPYMSQNKFCEKYGLNAAMLSRYMNETVAAVRKHHKEKGQPVYPVNPRIASWDKIEQINNALDAETKLHKGIK